MPMGIKKDRQPRSRSLAEFPPAGGKFFKRFFPRHARGKKHFSARKRASNASALQRAANLLKKTTQEFPPALFFDVNYTSWMIAISAASPRRGPILTIRV